MNKKVHIKRFKVFNFIAFTFVGPTHMWQRLVYNVCYQNVNVLSTILDQVGTSCNRPFGVQAQVFHTTWFLLTKKRLIR